MQSVIDKLGSILIQKHKKLELSLKDGMRKAPKLQLFDYSINDQRHRHATRYATIAASVVANALVLNKVLNVQPYFDPIISSARTARASREVQSDTEQREGARARSKMK